MLRQIKHTSCNIDVATLLGGNFISNKMSCYLKFTSCNKDAAALLTDN